MKQKQKNYKAGQIVTINHKRYRLIKLPNGSFACQGCDFKPKSVREIPCNWCIKNTRINIALKLL